MRANNSALIAQAARDRRAATLHRAREALQHLDRTGQPITFAAVAKAAPVSRAWLYREPSLRNEIQRLRGQRTDEAAATPPSSQRASGESLRRRLDAALEEIARLKQENRHLRDQVARLHGERRAANAEAPAPRRPAP